MCRHDSRGVAIGPPERERGFIRPGTQHVAVYGCEELFSTLVGDPLLVGVSWTLESRNTVVMLGDEALKT